MRSPVAGKARVHELAKELGVESKVVLARLKELGEFVKSASSTVETPVARRLRESFPAEASSTPAPTKAPAKKPSAARKPAAPVPAPPAPGPTAGAHDVEAKAAEAKVAEIKAAQAAAV